MNLESAKKAAKLYEKLREADDKIVFFKQFIPKKKSKTIAFSFWSKQAPKLGVATLLPDDSGYFEPDEELIGFLVASYESRKERLIKEIDAL